MALTCQNSVSFVPPEYIIESYLLVLQAADRITDLILRSTRYEMLHNDREALRALVLP